MQPFSDLSNFSLGRIRMFSTAIHRSRKYRPFASQVLKALRMSRCRNSRLGSGLGISLYQGTPLVQERGGVLPNPPAVMGRSGRAIVHLEY